MVSNTATFYVCTNMKVFLILPLVVFFLACMENATPLSDVNKAKPMKFLALGDSYTIGESVATEERWPVQLAKALTTNEQIVTSQIIATTGWRTDDLKRAIVAANPPSDFEFVSLLIGVNNQYQGKSAESYAPEFEELLQMAVGFAGGDKSKVFVVSIPDYGYTPFGKSKRVEISEAIDKFNAVNKSITEKLGVRYFYITDLTRKGLDDPSLVANDGLHPSGKMYSLWVDRILLGLR